MKLVFIGTASFAVPSLTSLMAAGHHVALVVTQPDRPGDRLKLAAPAVKVAAEKLGLPVIQPELIREDAAVDRLRQAGPELMVVVAYGQIISRSVLELPPRGILNVHASLLPRWRGAAPINHALLAGDRLTGVTIMQMDELLDHGPILAAAGLEIGPNDDAVSLGARLAEAGGELLAHTLSRLDEIVPHEQDHDWATSAPKLRKEDGRLEWDLPAEEIDRRVRGLQPWPGVTLPLGGRRIKVHRGRPVEGAGRPGEVLAEGAEGVLVAAAAGAYLLEVVQAPGGRPVPARVLAKRG